MDELSRVIRDLMNSLPASGPEDAASPASSAMPDGESSAETLVSQPPESGGTPAEQNAVEAGSFGGGDLSGILGNFGGGIPEQNTRVQLLLALKPHLSEHRCSCIDRLCRLLSTAYGIRSALQILGKV